MPEPAFLPSFDAALDAIDAARRAGQRTKDGAPADAPLARLREALLAERAAAVTRGAVDRARIGLLVRELVTWYPESQVKLIAALGAVARGE